jgi:hypothetical protein
MLPFLFLSRSEVAVYEAVGQEKAVRLPQIGKIKYCELLTINFYSIDYALFEAQISKVQRIDSAAFVNDPMYEYTNVGYCRAPV